MSAEVIKEFLVNLGFSLDEASLKKFSTNIAGATKQVMTFGAELATAAVAVEAGVARIADQMDKLYWASQRTGATVDRIQGLEFAAKQMGGTAQQARGALEGLAAFMRSTPASGAFLNKLGVTTNGRDTTDILKDLVGKFRQMPFWRAKAYAQFMGIDEGTLLVLMRNVEQFSDRYKELYKVAGIDGNEAAKSSHEFMVQVGELTAALEVLWTAGASHFLPWLTELVKTLDSVVVKFITLDKATEGWSTSILALVAALGSLKGAQWALRLLGIGGATAAATEGAVGGGLMAGAMRFLGPVGAFFSTWHGGGLNEGEDGQVVNGNYVGGTHTGSDTAKRNNPGNLRKWGDAKTSGGFAVFKDMIEGISAASGNLLSYARKGRDSVSSIVNHWAPSSDGNNVPAYIADLVKRLGVSANEHLNLMDPNVQQRLLGALFHHEGTDVRGDLIAAGVNSRFSQVGLRGAGGVGGGDSRSVVINQKTDIHVSGDGASSTGRAVASEQSRVNGDLLRNTTGALR